MVDDRMRSPSPQSDDQPERNQCQKGDGGHRDAEHRLEGPGSPPFEGEPLISCLPFAAPLQAVIAEQIFLGWIDHRDWSRARHVQSEMKIILCFLTGSQSVNGASETSFMSFCVKSE